MGMWAKTLTSSRLPTCSLTHYFLSSQPDLAQRGEKDAAKDEDIHQKEERDDEPMAVGQVNPAKTALICLGGIVFPSK